MELLKKKERFFVAIFLKESCVKIIHYICIFGIQYCIKKTFLFFSNGEDMFKCIKNHKNQNVIYLFGKKVLTLKSKSMQLTKINEEIQQVKSISKSIISTVRVENLPPAQGVLRDMQLAELKILKELDKVCKAHKLTYWIDFGTLLGAMRHKGFIPWDDDIDVCMVREDYQRIIEIFNNNKTDNRLEAILHSNPHGSYNLIKIIHKDIPNIFVDIFPVDFCYKKITDTEKLEFSNQIKKIIDENHKKPDSNEPLEKIHKRFIEIRDKCIENIKPDKNISEPTVFYGLEFKHDSHLYNAFDYQTIFPLKRITFEKNEFPCVNNADLYLTYIFGDYMQLPEILHYHTEIKNINIDEIIKIKKYLKEL